MTSNPVLPPSTLVVSLVRVKQWVLASLSILLFSAVSNGQWVDTGPSSPINPTQLRHFFCLAPFGQDVLWATPVHPTFQDVREVARTTDGGQSWEVSLLPETDGNHSPVRIVARSAGEAWVIAPRYPAPGRSRLFHTTNGGQDWTDVPGPFNDLNRGVQNIHFFNGQEAVVFGSPRTGTLSIDLIRIYRTDDGGATWTELDEPFVPIPQQGESYLLFSGNDSYAHVGDTLWFATTQNRIYRTTNKGASWQVFSTGLPGSTTIAGLASVAFRDGFHGMVVSFNPQQGAVTTNGGATWTTIEMPPSPVARCVQYVPGSGNTFVVTDGYDGNSGNIALTFDGGQSWEVLSGNPGMNAVAFLSGTAGWGGANITGSTSGIYKWNADLQTILSVHAADPDQTRIFPNPVQSVLTVRPERITSLDLLLEVYDVAGRLHMSERHAGVGQVQLEVSSLRNGVYLLVITSGDTTFSSRFVKY